MKPGAEQQPASIVDVLDQAAWKTPGHVAFEVPGMPGANTLTFGAWKEGSEDVAKLLVDEGIQPGDQVGVYVRDNHWGAFAVACFGVYRAGAILVPLPADADDPRHHHVAGLVARLRLRAIVSESEAAEIHGVRNIDLRRSGDLRGEALAHRQAAGDAVAILDFTTGTTNEPKIVAFTHADVAYACYEEPRIDILQRDDEGNVRVLVDTRTMTFHAGLMVNISLGSPCITVVIPPPSGSLERFLATVSAHRITRAIYSASELRHLATSRGRRALAASDVGSLRLVQVTAEPIDGDQLRSIAGTLPHTVFMLVYGSTESGPAQTAVYYRHGVDDPKVADTVGTPLRGTDLAIRSYEGADLPAGQRGQIWLRNATAPNRRYFRDGQLVDVVRKDWIPMGDIGFIDDSGLLHVLGRVNAPGDPDRQ